MKDKIALKLRLKFAEDTDDGYTKVYQKNNIEVFEMQSDYNNTSTLEFILDQRFYVRLDGTNLKAKELWQFADQLNFKKLI